MQDFLATLSQRSVNDRRGFCLGIYHRITCLRAGLLADPASNTFFVETEAELWSRFKLGGDLSDLAETAGALEARVPGEDDPFEFELDLYAILCLFEIVESIITTECSITPYVLEYFHETVAGTFQVLIYPGIVTAEVTKAVDENFQTKRENSFLSGLLERCIRLDSIPARENLERWVKQVSEGELWGPLRSEAASKNPPKDIPSKKDLRS